MNKTKININTLGRPLETFVSNIFNYDTYLEKFGEMFDMNEFVINDISKDVESESSKISNTQFRTLLNGDNLKPNYLEIKLNTVLLRGQGNYDTKKWKQSDINYITKKISTKCNFVDYSTIIQDLYVIDSKMIDDAGPIPEIERNMKFIREYEKSDKTESDSRGVELNNYFLLKVPKTIYAPLPMKVSSTYYNDNSSDLNTYIRRISIVEDYDKIFSNFYKFDSRGSNIIHRLRFSILPSIFVYIDQIVTSSSNSYWEFSMNINISKYIVDTSDVPQDIENVYISILGIVADFLGYFREESIVTKTFMSDLYKTPLKHTRESTYYGNPIVPHSQLNYNHLFYKSYPISSIVAYPNPNGILLELIVSKNFFAIIIEYSTYIKRYYLDKSKSSDIMTFSGSYTSYKCILYSDSISSNSSVFNILMANNNDEDLSEPLNILVIQKLYSYKDNVISEPSITGSQNIIMDNKIMGIINSFGFSLRFVNYNKTLNDIKLQESIIDMYERFKTSYPNINGINLYNSTDTTYVIYEDIIYNFIVNNVGSVVITGKHQEILNDIYNTEVVRNILALEYPENIIDALLMNPHYYFVYQVINDKLTNISMYLSKRNTESKWPGTDVNMKISDFLGLHMNVKYISYKTNLMLKDLQKININVVIYINPNDVIFHSNRLYILVEPSDFYIPELDNILVLRNYVEEFDKLNTFVNLHKIKAYALVFYNIYDDKYFNIFKVFEPRASYIIAMDYFMSDDIEDFDIWSYKWSKDSINVEEDKSFIIRNDDHIVKFLNGNYIKIYNRETMIRNINITNSRVVLKSLLGYGGISITNIIKTNIPSGNLFRLLSRHLRIVVIKRELIGATKTIEEVLATDNFRILRNGRVISFNIIKIQGILESIIYAIFGELDESLIENTLRELTIINLVDLDMPPMERNMGFEFQHNFIYLSSLYKLNFVFYDINNPNVVDLMIGNYSRTIYFITDKISIYPIIQGYELIESM